METKKYLTHVNALRGLAILLVFLYHLRATWCPQGFLGVDAFFVISGFFLIPRLLRANSEASPFSWSRYYAGRASRILPPLLVMVLAVLLATIPLMVASDMFYAAKAAQRVIAARSNSFFGHAAVDYFGPGVKENIFLHTWYISVLIQVLIAAPLLCRPLSRLRPIWGRLVLGLIALASLLIFFQRSLPPSWQDCLPEAFRDGGSKGSVYYMTAGRLWEIIAGAFVLFLPMTERRGIRTLLLSLGLLLLILSCFWPQNSSSLPLWAVVGTMLIIRYGENTHFSRLFENRALMWLGAVSFSFYLIHWPVMALARYALMRDFTPIDCLWATVLTALLTWALYRGVEKRRPRLIYVALLWGLAMLSVLVLRETDGLKNYIHAEANKALPDYTTTDYQQWKLAPESSWVGPYPRELNPLSWFYGNSVLNQESPDFGRAPILQVGDSSKQPNFILLGDSYADSLFPGFDIVARREGWSGLHINLYVTPFWNRLNVEMKDIDAGARFTRQKAEFLLQWLEQNPRLHYVVIFQRWNWRFQPAITWDGEVIGEEEAWSATANGLRTFLQRLKEMGREVVLIMPTPEARNTAGTTMAALLRRSKLWYCVADVRKNTQCSYEQYMEQNGRIRQILLEMQKEGLCTLVDPAPHMFVDGMFVAAEGREPQLRDYGHLTVYGSEKLMDALRSQFRSILQASDGKQEHEPEMKVPDREEQ